LYVRALEHVCYLPYCRAMVMEYGPFFLFLSVSCYALLTASVSFDFLFCLVLYLLYYVGRKSVIVCYFKNSFQFFGSCLFCER
jgi:hypothetical protein